MPNIGKDACDICGAAVRRFGTLPARFTIGLDFDCLLRRRGCGPVARPRG